MATFLCSYCLCSTFLCFSTLIFSIAFSFRNTHTHTHKMCIRDRHITMWYLPVIWFCARKLRLCDLPLLDHVQTFLLNFSVLLLHFCKQSVGNLLFKSSNPAFRILCLLLLLARTVSYTHLDVYKRQ